MPKVSVNVELSVEMEPGVNPVEIERAIDAEGKRAARELFVQALNVLDQLVSPKAGTRQRLEARNIATLFGRVRIHRYRVQKRGEKSFHPLDQLLNLSQAEPTAALREMLCEISCRTHYRQVADICSRIVGEPVGHLFVWRTVQQEGGRLIDEENKQVEMIFGDSPHELPSGPVAPDVVIVEADGTFLKAQGKDFSEDKRFFEIKTGVFYTGKQPAGGKKRKRWRLVGKGAHATADDADAFGKTFAVKGFEQAGLHCASHVVALHDGNDEFGKTFHDWFPGAIHQADRYHVNMRVWQIAEGDKDIYGELKKAVFDDPLGFARRLRAGEFELDQNKADEIASYLVSVGPHLSGIDKLPRRYRRGKMRIISTSVVEKHQDLLVGRRMKKRGMRWSKRGANNLLALQTRRVCDRWPTEWGVIEKP